MIDQKKKFIGILIFIPVFLAGSERIVLGDIQMKFHRVRFELSTGCNVFLSIDSIKKQILGKCTENDDIIKVTGNLNALIRRMQGVEERYINLIRKTTNGEFARKDIKKLMKLNVMLNQDDLMDLDLIDDYIPLPE